MKKFLLLLLALCIQQSTVLLAQKTTQPQIDMSKFKFITGKWAGNLEFTNYDDAKKINMPATFSCVRSELGDTYMFDVTLEKPEGQRSETIQIFSRGKTKNQIITTNFERLMAKSEVWYIKEFTENTAAKSLKIVMVKAGVDNKQAALMRQTINLQGNNLSMLNEVKYDEGDFFTRTNMKLTRR